MSRNVEFAARTLCVAFVSVCVTGCMSKRPVFYPNAHLDSVGTAQSQADVDACLNLASEYLGADSGVAGEAATRATKGSVIGGAAGAAGGAVAGRAGRGAAVGAASAATAGAVSGVLGANRPDAATRRFVERCLRERGYETIGWR